MKGQAFGAKFKIVKGWPGGCFSCSITDDADRLMETCATLCAGDYACKSFEIKPTSGECCIEHVDSSDTDYPNYWIDASAIVANCPDDISHEASLWDTYEPLTAAWRDGADARDTSMCHQFWDYTNDVSELWHYDEHERNGCQGQESASGSLNCAAASTGACLEGGGVDNDCCATCGNGGCAAGYTYARQVVIDSGTLSSTYPDFYPDCGTMYCGNTCCVPSSGGSDEDEGTGRSWVTITSGDYSWEGQKATCEAVGLSLATYYDLCPDGGDTPRSSALPFFDMSDVWVPYSSDCNGEVSNNWVEMGSSMHIWCGTHHDTNCDGIPTCCGGRPHWGLHPSMNGWQVDKVLCVGEDDEDMAACLACVNMECEGNEPHSEICSDCFGEDCDECRDAVGESELAAFVSGGCDFDDGSDIGRWFRDEGCGSLRGCCPITRDFCTNDASLPDNCNCGDCGYPACGDCDCDHYGDDHCCTGSPGSCIKLYDVETDKCEWETYEHSGDLDACRAKCAARLDCYAIQYESSGTSWCDGCTGSTDAVGADLSLWADTSGGAHVESRGCFATGSPANDFPAVCPVWYDESAYQYPFYYQDDPGADDLPNDLGAFRRNCRFHDHS